METLYNGILPKRNNFIVTEKKKPRHSAGQDRNQL